jgi:pimeloyl-ACP methyl ester carboxylesterase
MIRRQLLWSNGKGAPLVFLIPGGTGSSRDVMPGFPATAGFFWLRRGTSYIAETAGQDGNHGAFSIKRCFEECRSVLRELQEELAPDRIFVFGSCSGGTVATHLAAEMNVAKLILWESFPRYNESSQRDFISRAKGRISLSERFLEESLNAIDRAHEVTCPVLCLYGINGPSPIFNEQHVAELEATFTSAATFQRHQFEGASHNLTRGDDPELLLKLLEFIDGQLELH